MSFTLITKRLRPSRCLVGWVRAEKSGRLYQCVNVNRYPTRTVAWFLSPCGMLYKAEARGKPRGKMPCRISLTLHSAPFDSDPISLYNGSELNVNQPTKETI
jgi:hypothetical protein